MGLKTLLIRFPGYAFSPNKLIPNNHLAQAAAYLAEAGHDVQIQDFGTVEMMDRLFPPHCRDMMRELGDGLLGTPQPSALETARMVWQLRRAEQAFKTRRHGVTSELATLLARDRHVRLIGFCLQSADDVCSSLPLMRQLRERMPLTHLCGFGPFSDVYAEDLCPVLPVLHSIGICHAGSALVSLADAIDAGRAWQTVPNLVYAAGDSIKRTELVADKLPASRPKPSYDTEIYPALSGSAKAKMFTIEVAQILHSYGNGKIEALPAPRIALAERICDEMTQLHALHGARAFHVSDDGHSSADSGNVLAQRLLARGLRVTYSRQGKIGEPSQAIYPLMKSSGCVALQFRIHTGSQQLLEEHYGHLFGVTEVEQHFESCRRAGICTLAQFTFPCPRDDFHTEAETLRLVARTRPDAVRVNLPDPMRLALSNGERRGYAFDAARFASHVLHRGDGFATPSNPWQIPPYRIANWSAGEVMRRNDRLRRAIMELAIPIELCDHMSLFARFTGNAGQEQDLSLLVHRQLMTGDIVGLSEWIESFNDRACVAAHAGSVPREEAAKAAVGD